MSKLSFASSIIDRREPRMVRGKAIVRDRRMMRRPRPKLFLTQPESSRAMNTIAGTECCCGAPNCPNPCNAFDCQYCTGNSRLTTLTLTTVSEVWAPVSGAPIFPPCSNASGACPNHPADCAPLNPTESYERANSGEVGTGIIVHNWSLGQAVNMGACGVFSGTINLRNRQSGVKRTPFDNPPCSVSQPPTDVSGNHLFSFSRQDGGWELFSASGGTDFDFDASQCSGAPHCNAQTCDAKGVLHDLVCALLPLECEVGEIVADSGCIQRKTQGVQRCERGRERLQLVWNIER